MKEMMVLLSEIGLLAPVRPPMPEAEHLINVGPSGLPHYAWACARDRYIKCRRLGTLQRATIMPTKEDHR
jgi:hypothetical protein